MNKIFGTEEWESEFYREGSEVEFGLSFGKAPRRRTATLDDVKRFILKRLHTAFPLVHESPAELTNSQNSPMYLFCFAASNQKGGPIALEIADHLLKNINGR